MKCCMCKRKVRRNSVPLDKYALQAAQLCRVPLLSMTSNNTWDYFDASSDKNRVVWYSAPNQVIRKPHDASRICSHRSARRISPRITKTSATAIANAPRLYGESPAYKIPKRPSSVQ